jgi:cupin 2 domain-containing protein
MIRCGNLVATAPSSLAEEQFTLLAHSATMKIERIVSTGQASPPGFWFDQDFCEWVLLVAGSAGLLIEGESALRVLKPGDYVEIPAHIRHRVEWTEAGAATVWLAVHFSQDLSNPGGGLPSP